jgi:hypothetical protein
MTSIDREIGGRASRAAHVGLGSPAASARMSGSPPVYLSCRLLQYQNRQDRAGAVKFSANVFDPAGSTRTMQACERASARSLAIVTHLRYGAKKIDRRSTVRVKEIAWK